MITYVDSSILLRMLFREPGRLRPAEWAKIKTLVSSELLRVECLRTIDRARLRFGLTPEAVGDQKADILERLGGISLVSLDRNVLERAASPLSTSLATSDAIHLASALLARPVYPGLVFATHDRELASCARAEGFHVLGA